MNNEAKSMNLIKLFIEFVRLRIESLQKFYDEAWQDGYNDGYQKGYDAGYYEGHYDGKNGTERIG